MQKYGFPTSLESFFFLPVISKSLHPKIFYSAGNILWEGMEGR